MPSRDRLLEPCRLNVMFGSLLLVTSTGTCAGGRELALNRSVVAALPVVTVCWPRRKVIEYIPCRRWLQSPTPQPQAPKRCVI